MSRFAFLPIAFLACMAMVASGPLVSVRLQRDLNGFESQKTLKHVHMMPMKLVLSPLIQAVKRADPNGSEARKILEHGLKVINFKGGVKSIQEVFRAEDHGKLHWYDIKFTSNDGKKCDATILDERRESQSKAYCL